MIAHILLAFACFVSVLIFALISIVSIKLGLMLYNRGRKQEDNDARQIGDENVVYWT